MEKDKIMNFFYKNQWQQMNFKYFKLNKDKIIIIKIMIQDLQWVQH